MVWGGVWWVVKVTWWIGRLEACRVGVRLFFWVTWGLLRRSLVVVFGIVVVEFWGRCFVFRYDEELA